MVGSDLMWSPFYGKTASSTARCIHFEAFLLGGATVFKLNRAGGFRPGVNVGLGVRVFKSDTSPSGWTSPTTSSSPAPRASSTSSPSSSAPRSTSAPRNDADAPPTAALASAALLAPALASGPLGTAGAPPTLLPRACPGRSPAARSGARGRSPLRPPATPPSARARRGQPRRKAEAPPPPPEKVDPKLFDEALTTYFDGNPRDAAGPLYAWLAAAPADGRELRLGAVLPGAQPDRLGLRHAGAVYLAAHRPRAHQPRRCCPARWRRCKDADRPAARRGDDRRAGVRRAGPGLPAEEAGAYAHYQQGLVDLRVGNERWANTHFAKLRRGHAPRPRARSSRCWSPA